jgi:hypothetical protein
MRERTKIILVVAVVTSYGIAAWVTAVWAIATHTPCTSNFEGGCGYAKSMAGLFAWLASCLATGAAAAIAGMAALFPKAKVKLITAGIVLGAPTLAYVVYGLYAVVSWLLKNNML